MPSATVRIAVDLHSGVPRNGEDPTEVALEGVHKFNEDYPEIRLLLIGDQSRTREFLHTHADLRIVSETLHAPGVVSMEWTPEEARLNGRGTSMRAMVHALRDGQAQAGLSAGNTGGLIFQGIELGRINRDSRIALASLYPIKKEGQYLILLDVGARTLPPSVGLLVCHAVKGAALFKARFGKDRPNVALLNIGEEKHKGSAEVREAAHVLHDLAEQTRLFNFVGFIEANDMPNGAADVVVTDGVTGNHVIKASEATGNYAAWVLKRMAKQNVGARVCAALFFKVLARREAALLKPDTHNGAVVLGLEKPLIKIHGGSGSEGFKAGLVLAMHMAEGDLALITKKHLDALPEEFKYQNRSER